MHAEDTQRPTIALTLWRQGRARREAEPQADAREEGDGTQHNTTKHGEEVKNRDEWTRAKGNTKKTEKEDHKDAHGERKQTQTEDGAPKEASSATAQDRIAWLLGITAYFATLA
ncbi:hypothetical protein ERJ75_000290800 [Trypanosoma vivax]|nr:hypothetical protein ERJ75_000290800 [Trypanosoma vivax]